MNTATQTLTATNNITREAVCPEHRGKPTKKNPNGTTVKKYLGLQPSLVDDAVYWRFWCKKGSHTFLALPDPNAPANSEEVAKWNIEQKMRRAGLALSRSQS